jgi:fumarate reductase flavoprotein subunit
MKYQITAQKECDLIILGGGGGGMVAAARAASLSGKKVIVLEKTGHTGGGAVFASMIRTFGSKWQKERNLPDVMNQFIIDAMDSTYWRLDPRLVSNTFRATGEFFDWFCEIGDNVEGEFEVGFYIFDGPDGPKVPLLKGTRSHWGAGQLIMRTMLEQCKKLGVEVLTRHKVVDVEVKKGRIAAVIAETANGPLRVKCRACILATGSWVNNKEVMKKISPAFLKAKIDPVCKAHCNPAYTGDGISLAKKAGAFLDYDSFCLRLMGPVTLSRSEVMNNMGNSPYSIFVNKNGKRWSCEAPQVRMGLFNAGHALLEQPGSVSFAVFDENILSVAIEESRKPCEGYAGFFGHPEFPETMKGVYADMDKAINYRNGSAFKADTLKELAEKMGVSAKDLKATVAAYNASCDAGMDRDYFKPAKNLVPMNKPPYYAVKGNLGTDGAFGGVLVNPDTQAYRDGGGLVEGLYVVGDFASGRFINMGGVKVQVINDCSWAFAGGFIAAANACKYLDEIAG